MGGSTRWNCRVYSGKAILPEVLWIRDVYPGSELSMPDLRFRIPAEKYVKMKKFFEKNSVWEKSLEPVPYRYTDTLKPGPKH